MRKLSGYILSTAMLVVLCGCTATDRTPAETLPEVALTAQTFNPNANAIEEHMSFLADDALEGREAGSAGYDKAADYVANAFEELGLKPAGENGTFFQNVRLKRGYRIADVGNMVVQTNNDDTISMIKNKDYVIGASVRHAENTITAPVVFVGFGVVAPKEGRDDYAGLDVEGKIVATLSGTPGGIEPEERAFYGAQKTKEASDRGAIGGISLATKTSEKIYSFERVVEEGRADSAAMSWVKPDGEVFSKAPGLRGGAYVSMTGAEKLFEGAPSSWSEIVELAEKEGGVTPTFDLPITITVTQASKLDEVTSANVAGIIEGTDPALKDEVIVLTAHLDGLGIASIDADDVINNGALDNAAGIATLLEAARMMMENSPPRRSVMFLAVTAEEKGLLGAQYFAKNPTVPINNIVANINLDMPILTYDFTDIIVFGGTRSTLEPAIKEAAAQMDITIGPDPFPEQGIFTRSDHFRFVEEGIPSVMISTGFANGGGAAYAAHFAKHYHQPADDMNNNLDFNAAAKFAELKTRIAFTVANQDERPMWKNNDFFAKQFDGPMTK